MMKTAIFAISIPDTKYGCYKITKPKHEQQAMADFKREHGEHHRYLCKNGTSMEKSIVGVGMGGLLIRYSNL